MLTAKKVMKRERFKKKTVVLSALEVLVFAPYGNSANRVETAPVPVETCEIVRDINRNREHVYHHWTWQLIEGREVALETAICRGHAWMTRKQAYPYSPQTMLVGNGYRMSDNWSRTDLGNTPDTVRYAFLL